jgi:hypothetical protein
MDSSNKVYVVSTENERIQVIVFNALSAFPITPSVKKTHGSSTYPMVAGGMTLTNGFDQFYIGGNIDGSMMLLKVSASSGALGF